MRRALLTRAAGVVPISVGNPAVAAVASFSGNRFGLDLVTPANASGTLTTAKLYASAGGTVYVMTGSVSGSQYTVRAISAALTAVANLNTFAVSLPVVAGDYLGFWTPSTGGVTLSYDSATGTGGYGANPPSVPTAGSAITFATFTGKMSILGTSP